MKVNVQMSVDLEELAKEMAHQLDDEQGIEFLTILDEKMASWNFTLKAAQFFVGASLKMTETPGRPMETGALARVGEFLRQVRVHPHVMAAQPIIGVWTDPSADYAALDAGDLELVVELAAAHLRTLPNPEGE